MNRHNRLGWRRKGFIFAFLAPTLIAFVIFYLYPIVTVFVTSFCKWDYTNINAPEFFGIKNMWDNYKYIFHTLSIFLGGTEKFFSMGTFGSCHPNPDRYIDCTCIFQKDERGKLIRNIYIIPNMISTAAMGMIFLQLYSPLYGVVNPIIKLFNKDFKDSILLLE